MEKKNINYPFPVSGRQTPFRKLNTINLFRVQFETYYIEIPLMVIYMIWTNLNFFHQEIAWKVIIKSSVCLVIAWYTSNLITKQIVDLMM